MKNIIVISALLTALSVNAFAQPQVPESAILSALGNQIARVNDSTYEGGTYAIGRDSVRVYRTYWQFSLFSIPSNATITKVTVNYSNGGNNCCSLKLTQLATVNQNDLGANWNAIGNGTTLHSGLPYNGTSFVSDPLKTAIANALSSGKIIIGALSESENTNGSNALMNLYLYVEYTRPAVQLSLTARNDLNGADGGNIGVGIYPNAPASHPSPYYFKAYETDRLNLTAYDNQVVNGKNWIFNDTEGASNKSEWDDQVNRKVLNTWWTASVTTHALTADENNAVFTAYLKTNTYTTSGTMTASEVWFTGPVTLTGNLIIPSGVTLTIDTGVTVNLGSYGIILNGGSVDIKSGATVNCAYLKQNGAIIGYFGSIQSAINYASSGQTIELQPRTYNENPNFTSKSNI
ncbi:MAG: hypothetical protein ACPL7O_08200, partial [Armatimonadota bacterium]